MRHRGDAGEIDQQTKRQTDRARRGKKEIWRVIEIDLERKSFSREKGGKECRLNTQIELAYESFTSK